VVRTVPPDDATNVDPNAHVKAKFSEAMKYRTINTNTFYLVVGVARPNVSGSLPRCVTMAIPRQPY
jgi:Bacterial Ig-like domain